MQGNLLSRLKGMAYIVEVLGNGPCFYAGRTWQAILIAPVAQKLKSCTMLQVALPIQSKEICTPGCHPQQVWTAERQIKYCTDTNSDETVNRPLKDAMPPRCSAPYFTTQFFFYITPYNLKKAGPGAHDPL
ncbi:TPA: hypothetical protein ACH3X1_009937 [Trebouxia sp. C0004]